MRNSANPPMSPGPSHPFFATRASQPTSPSTQREPKLIDKLLKETITNISQLAAPSTVDVHRTSILNTFERLSSANVLSPGLRKQEESKKRSPNGTPEQFHSTAASNSMAPNLGAEALAGISFPTTPAVAINVLGKFLTNIEVSEILNYKTIYYLGSQSEKVRGDLSLPNSGYDDDRNDYRIVIGDHLDYRYEIQELLGKGAFARVVKCFDHKESTHVAIKIVRNARRFHRQVQVELQILNLLRDRRIPHTIRFLEQFSFRNHVCLTFELLSLNLYDYLKQNRFRGFPLKWVRNVTQQLIETLVELKKCRIIHCDLKPENILFLDNTRGGVKLIDFGSACFETAQMYTYIQSRFYRSPEVILGVKYSFPIDMWSLGCVLAELYTGRPIFPGETETDQLLWIMSVCGYPPLELLSKSSKKSMFFDQSGEVKIVPNSHGVKRMPGTQALSKLVPCNDAPMLDFIARCLDWIPDSRLTPEEAREHRFLVEPGSPDLY